MEAPGDPVPPAADPGTQEQELVEQISALYAKLEELRDRKVEQELSAATQPHTPRVILVSRRLPFQLHREAEGWRAEPSPNAASDQAAQNYTALNQLRDVAWVGWPGTVVDPSEQSTLREKLLAEHRFVPVFFEEKRESLFYDGFCKQILWPLFHSSTPTTEDTLTTHSVEDDEQQQDEVKLWQAYVSINQTFADAVQDVYEEGDHIWVQDYHLLLLPQMLRSLMPNSKIGFFLHVPFPSSELYRILPFREELLRGVLGADLVGFQTFDYARHFLASCEAVLLCDIDNMLVELNDHCTEICICPVGIDTDAVAAVAQSQEVVDEMDRVAKQFEGRKIILGVDTLDPTKGLIHKFLAVEELFSNYPELSEKVVFVQVGLATHSDRREIQVLESQINTMVTRINSRSVRNFEDPIQYLTGRFKAETLCALFAMADVMVVTPIRDGMNTTPYEYVVCREVHHRCATLVLSEFAGCARSLGSAMLVNPWNTTQLADTLLESLDMDGRQDADAGDLDARDDLVRAHNRMYQYVRNFTSHTWAKRFLEQLGEANRDRVRTTCLELQANRLTQSFVRARSRLLVLSLEGLLCRPRSMPELLEISEPVLRALRILAADPANTVIIKSGRSPETMERCVGDLHVALAAEHGLFLRWGPEEQWEQLRNNDMSWTESVLPILDYYTERAPGSVIEVRRSSVVWHYRDCDLAHGAWQAKQCMVSLAQLGRRMPIVACVGNKSIEVRPILSTPLPNLLELALKRLEPASTEEEPQPAPDLAPELNSKAADVGDIAAAGTAAPNDSPSDAVAASDTSAAAATTAAAANAVAEDGSAAPPTRDPADFALAPAAAPAVLATAADALVPRSAAVTATAKPPPALEPPAAVPAVPAAAPAVAEDEAGVDGLRAGAGEATAMTGDGNTTAISAAATSEPAGQHLQGARGAAAAAVGPAAAGEGEGTGEVETGSTRSLISDQADESVQTDLDPAVDFILAITTGDDLTDEDIYELMAPAPFDLDEFCKLMSETETDRGEESEEEKTATLDRGAADVAGEGVALVPFQGEGPYQLAAGREGEDRFEGRRDHTLSSDHSESSSPPDHSPLSGADLLLHGSAGAFRTVAGDFSNAAGGGGNASPVPHFAAPHAELSLQAAPPPPRSPQKTSAQPTAARQHNISSQQHFAPRKDYPPPGMIFQAIKRRYGSNYDKHALPDNPAAAWAFVNNAQATVPNDASLTDVPVQPSMPMIGQAVQVLSGLFSTSPFTSDAGKPTGPDGTGGALVRTTSTGSDGSFKRWRSTTPNHSPQLPVTDGPVADLSRLALPAPAPASEAAAGGRRAMDSRAALPVVSEGSPQSAPTALDAHAAAPADTTAAAATAAAVPTNAAGETPLLSTAVTADAADAVRASSKPGAGPRPTRPPSRGIGEDVRPGLTSSPTSQTQASTTAGANTSSGGSNRSKRPLPLDSYSCIVGAQLSQAMYYVKNMDHGQEALFALADFSLDEASTAAVADGAAAATAQSGA